MILVRPGDILVSGINAAKGAVAICGSEDDKPIAATVHYSAYFLKQDRADSRYLWWLLRSKLFRTILASHFPGGIKTELTPRKFLSIRVPIPPLESQRGIVRKLHNMTERISEAQELRQQSMSVTDDICRSIFFEKTNSPLELVPMRQLIKLRGPDIVVNPAEKYRFAGVYSFGKGLFQGKERVGVEFAYRHLSRVRTGDFVYPKLMAWEGAMGVVPLECDGLFVSPEFCVFEVNRKLVLPETLDTYFRMPSVWPLLSEVSTGTNVRRRRLNPRDFLKFEMPLPSMSTQAKIQKIKAKIDELRRLETETATQLKTLHDSIIEELINDNAAETPSTQIGGRS